VPVWFLGSCPNHIRRGVCRGAASPPAGVCSGIQEPSCSQRLDAEVSPRVEQTPPGGCTPGPPRDDCPGCAGDGRGGLVLDEKIWMVRPGRFLGSCPNRIRRGGVGGQPAPRLVSAPAFRNPHALSAWMRKYPRGWSGHRPGVAPPDPRVRLPWKCGGRAERRGPQ